MAPYASTVLEKVKMWQSPMASERRKLSLQIVPQRPAKNISTRPAVRELDVSSLLDTSLTAEVAEHS